MLRITVEIVPFGNELLKKPIGVMTITNDGTYRGILNAGNYDISQSEIIFEPVRYSTDVNLLPQYKDHHFHVDGAQRNQPIFSFIYEILRGFYNRAEKRP